MFNTTQHEGCDIGKVGVTKDKGLSLLHLKYLSFANFAKPCDHVGSWVGPVQKKGHEAQVLSASP